MRRHLALILALGYLAWAPAPTISPALTRFTAPALAAPTPFGITEDGALWTCEVMGNHTCGSTIYFVHSDGSLHGYDVNAPSRPACFVEPSDNRNGYDVTFYPNMDERTDHLGFEVTCQA